MKKIIITIDAEGDNLWNHLPGQTITTENSKYVPRFQELCNKYGLKPTYLVNYEMALDDYFVNNSLKWLKHDLCEIGMHMHAWSTPPYYELPIRSTVRPGDCSYVHEYPNEAMNSKVKEITDLIIQRWDGYRPICHRGGRWGINANYLEILQRNGYLVDCSVIPGTKMEGDGFSQCGIVSDYSLCPNRPFRANGNNGILEIPLTTMENHFVKNDGRNGLKHLAYKCYKAAKGRGQLRLYPGTANMCDLIRMTDKIARGTSDYIMFVLHTAEMMPGGSPRFSTEEDVEILYQDLELLFSHAALNYEGCTLREYAKQFYKKSLPVGTVQ